MVRKLFGPVIQNGFVVKDLDKAIDAWVKLGVGPFFIMHDNSYATTRYRGEIQPAAFSMAIAYWNDIQIELIAPHDSTPSVYNEFVDEGLEGFHHVLTTTDDMSALVAALHLDGHELLADVDIGANGRVIYFRMAGQQWPLIEVGEFQRPIYELFEMIRAASKDWDGIDPLRVIG